MQKYKALLADQDWYSDYLAEVSLKEGKSRIYEADRKISLEVPGWFRHSGLAKKIYGRPPHGMSEDFGSHCVWLLSDEEYELIKDVITKFTDDNVNELRLKADVKIVGV